MSRDTTDDKPKPPAPAAASNRADGAGDARPTGHAGTAPAPPGRAMVLARLGIVLALSVGVLVFGVLAIRDLTAGMETTRRAPQADTRALDPSNAAPGTGPGTTPGTSRGSGSPADQIIDAITGQGAASAQYLPLDHDPAHLRPYPGAQREFCKRLANGEQYGDDQARYLGVQATVADVLAHYARVAGEAGFTPRGEPQPLRADPDGRRQVWIRGGDILAVTIMSPTLGPPQPPPARPPVPSLSYTVQLRYPIASAP